MTTLAQLLGAVREGRPPPVLDFLAEQRRRRTRPEDLPWWERPRFAPEAGEDAMAAHRPGRGSRALLSTAEAGPAAGAAVPASPSAGPDDHAAQPWHRALAGDDMAAKLDAVRKLGDAAKRNPEALKGLDPVDRYMVELAADLIDKGYNPMQSVDAAERTALILKGPSGVTGGEALERRRAEVGARRWPDWQAPEAKPEEAEEVHERTWWEELADRVAKDVRESLRRMIESVADPSNAPADPPGPDDVPPAPPPRPVTVEQDRKHRGSRGKGARVL